MYWDPIDAHLRSIEFDCPKCLKHRIDIPILPTKDGWKMTGNNNAELTITPSIAHTCFDSDDTSPDGKSGRICESHFYITNGEIIML